MPFKSSDEIMNEMIIYLDVFRVIMKIQYWISSNLSSIDAVIVEKARILDGNLELT